MKTFRILTGLIIAVLLSISFVSCDDDDDVDVTKKSLVGYWVCTSQKWVEDGESWSSNYDEDDDYYICFDDDFTGYMDSGYDELMEKGGYYSFVWSISGNNILITFTKSGSTDKWQVKAISDKNLELYWKDEDYNITCKFRKE